MGDELKNMELVIGGLQRAVHDLSKIVRDGNGQPPLIARVLVVERELLTLQKLTDSIEEDQRDISEELQQINLAAQGLKNNIDHIERDFRSQLSAACSRISTLESEKQESKSTNREWVKVFVNFALSVIGAVLAAIIVSKAMNKRPEENPSDYAVHHTMSHAENETPQQVAPKPSTEQ